MVKMKNLTLLEEEILKFLRRSFSISNDKVKEELQRFLLSIKKFERNRFQTRVFVYLDIISWAESKVYHKPVHEVIQQKYLQDIENRNKDRDDSRAISGA